MKRKQALLALSGFFLLSLTSCTPTPEGSSVASSASTAESSAKSESEHVHNYEAHAAVDATCASEGNEAYYSCTLCDALFDASKNPITEIPVTAKDPNNHKGTPAFIYTGTYKNSFAVGDTFSLGEEAVYKIKCEDCDGNPLTAKQIENVKYTYPTEGATAFTAADVGTDKKVVAKYGNYETLTFTVSVAKRVTSIEGIKDIDEHCGYAAFTELGYVTPSEGKVVYAFSETENGKYVSAEDFNKAHPEGMTAGGNDATSKTYYAKATIEETAEYTGISKLFKINITHQNAEDIKWGESADKTSDIYGCPDKTPISFKKTVTKDNQDILLNDQPADTAYALDLTGVDTYKEVVSIKYGEYDLGTDIASLTIPAALKNDVSKHGEGNIEVTVHSDAKDGAPETDHLIKVPVTFITKEIASADDFKNWCTATDKKLIVDGYFRQTADSITPKRNRLSGWNDYFIGTYDGNGKAIAFNSNGEEEKTGEKTITYTNGIFGNNLGEKGNGATIKNLTINDGWHTNGMDYVLLAKAVWDTTFNNVNFVLGGTNAYKMEWNSGWLASQRMQNTSFDGCIFSCIGLEIGALLGGHLTVKENGETSYNYSDITFNNSTLNVKNYWCLWNNKSNNNIGDDDSKVMTADGLTINTGVLRNNAIAGLKDNYDEHCGFKAFDTLDGVKAASEKKINYTFSKTKDGNYVSADEFNKANPKGMVVEGDATSTVYYGKATAEGGASYKDATKEFTITITHQTGLEWNTTGDDYDTFGKCACKNEEPIKFSKKVTATNQDIDLNGTADQKISLEGIGAYESVKSIKFGDYDLGTNLNKLTISDNLKKDYDKHGKAELVVVVHSAATDDVTEADHTIKVPVTLLTKAIASKDDLKNYVQLSATKTTVQGYFKQTADISEPETSAHGWNGYYFIGTYDGGGKSITTKSSGLSNGIFGHLGKKDSTTADIQATIKNLTLIDTWYNAGGSTAMIAKSVWNTLFEKVTVKSDGGGSTYTGKLEESNGWLCCNPCRNSKFVNCTFDAPSLSLGSLLGGNNNYKGTIATFEECNLKAKSYICIYFTGAIAEAEKVITAEGLKIEATLTA